MQAVYFSNNQLTVADRPAPNPVDDVLVEVHLAGICRTDLELVKGYMGFTGIPGHEFVGIAKNGPLAGKRVVGDINCACRECSVCAAGQFHHCPNRSVLGIAGRDGVFAEYMCLPAVNLVPVPDHVSNQTAVFAEPLAAALRITEQVDLQKGMSVAVLGDGKLGLLCALVLARHAGMDVTLLGRHQKKMDLVNGPGMTTALVGKTSFPASSFDLVVEATGREEGLLHAADLVRPLGILVMKSTIAATANMNLAPLVVKEVQMIGSRCGSPGAAMEMLARKVIDPTVLVDRIYPLQQGLKAFAAAARSGALKVLLEIC